MLHLFALGKLICTGADDATLRIWNPKDGKNIHVVEGEYIIIFNYNMLLFVLNLY